VPGAQPGLPRARARGAGPARRRRGLLQRQELDWPRRSRHPRAHRRHPALRPGAARLPRPVVDRTDPAQLPHRGASRGGGEPGHRLRRPACARPGRDDRSSCPLADDVRRRDHLRCRRHLRRPP